MAATWLQKKKKKAAGYIIELFGHCCISAKG